MGPGLQGAGLRAQEGWLGPRIPPNPDTTLTTSPTESGEPSTTR
jgi:hypothetical protein